MIDLPMKTEAPLSRESLGSINRKRESAPLDRGSVAQLNRGPTAAVEPPAPAVPPSAPLPTPAPVPAPAPMAVPPLQNVARKGQKLPLEADRPLGQLQVRLGWNVLNGACDVDVSAFLLHEGRVLGDDWFVFYGQPESPDGSVRFSGEAAPDREQIQVDFTRLNSGVDRLVFILTINEALEKRLNFSMLKDAYIRLIDPASNRELVSFQIDEYYPAVISMTIGEIYRHNGAWKFSAVGNGVGKDLAGLCELYGVQVV